MRKLKTTGGLTPYDPSETFRDHSKVLTALLECLKDGDSEAFKEILSVYLDVTNKDEFAKKSGISRRTLFRMLSPSGNPTLDNIAKVMKAIHKAA